MVDLVLEMPDVFQGGIVWQCIESIDDDLVVDGDVGEHVDRLLVVLFLHIVLPLTFSCVEVVY